MNEPGHDTSTFDEVDVEVRCPVETRVLSMLRCIVGALADQVGFEPEELAQIEMAVDEACSNVICHAYKHLGISPRLPPEEQRPDHLRECVLRIKARLGRNYLRISIIDNGIGLNKTPPGVKSLKEYSDRGGKGGLGIYIISNFMDEVEYDFPPESGTILTMTKYLRATAEQQN